MRSEVFLERGRLGTHELFSYEKEVATNWWAARKQTLAR